MTTMGSITDRFPLRSLLTAVVTTDVRLYRFSGE